VALREEKDQLSPERFAGSISGDKWLCFLRQAALSHCNNHCRNFAPFLAAVDGPNDGEKLWQLNPS
jgi:hypothetical protein